MEFVAPGLAVDIPEALKRTDANDLSSRVLPSFSVRPERYHKSANGAADTCGKQRSQKQSSPAHNFAHLSSS